MKNQRLFSTKPHCYLKNNWYANYDYSDMGIVDIFSKNEFSELVKIPMSVKYQWTDLSTFK